MVSLERSWQIERPEASPFFNFIYGAGRQAGKWTEPAKQPAEPGVNPNDYDLDMCVQWFREVPEDLIEWTVKNSDRNDLGQVNLNRHRRQVTDRVLPVAERRLMRWNGDPYALDGGSGGLEKDDGTFILLPYWMGKYHRFLK